MAFWDTDSSICSPSTISINSHRILYQRNRRLGYKLNRCSRCELTGTVCLFPSPRTQLFALVGLWHGLRGRCSAVPFLSQASPSSSLSFKLQLPTFCPVPRRLSHLPTYLLTCFETFPLPPHDLDRLLSSHWRSFHSTDDHHIASSGYTIQIRFSTEPDNTRERVLATFTKT